MPRLCYFIDTSVLCLLLKIPGFENSGPSTVTHDDIKGMFTAVCTDQQLSLALPVAAIIETGNHIAQIKDSDERRDRAAILTDMLDKASQHTAPWQLAAVQWDDQLIKRIFHTSSMGGSFVDLVPSKIGIGDISIWEEAVSFEERSQIEARVWSIDNDLLSRGAVRDPRQ